MFLIKGVLESSVRMTPTLIYNLDVEENQSIPTQDGIIVDTILPYPAYKKGVNFVHYINPETKEQWYEEVVRALTQDELMQEQNEKIDLILQMQMSTSGVI